MKPSVTQEKSLAIVALAERLGWTVSKFETRGKTLFRGSPRFVLVLRREKNDFLLEIFTVTLYIGSGRASGNFSHLRFGEPYEKKIRNWNEADSLLRIYTNQPRKA